MHFQYLQSLQIEFNMIMSYSSNTMPDSSKSRLLIFFKIQMIPEFFSILNSMKIHLHYYIL